MSLKRIKIISIFAIFFLCFLTHFVYEIMPCIITSFFFPVNESIYEHLKMIYTTVVIWELIELFIIKKNGIIINNRYFNIWLSGITNIFIFLFMYIPIRYLIGENMIVTFVLLFLSILFSQIISYYLLIQKNIIDNKLAICLIIFTFIGLAYFTYNPIHTFLFYDTKDKIYGIKKST